MFYQEPQITAQITAQPPLTQTFAPGQNITLSASAGKRGDGSTSGITYQWQVLPPGNDPSISNPLWTSAPDASNGPTYSVSSVPLSANGTYYRLLVSDNAGIDVSNPVSLKIAATGGTPVPGPPTGLTATTISTNQIDLSWKPGANDNAGFLLQRRAETGGAYATILDTTATVYHDNDPLHPLAPGTTYDYQVIAKGTPNSDASAFASAMTLPPNSTVRLLTVNSSNPASDVYVFVGPNDNNGQADGNTSFVRQYTSGTDVTLVAWASWNGANFQKWQKDGADWSTSTVTDVVMDTSHTMTAVYAPITQTGGSTSYNIAVSAFPTSGGSVTGNGSYASNANVAISAAPNTGYHFTNWTLNTSGGVVFSTAASPAAFPATSNLTVVANFTPDSIGYAITTAVSPANAGTTGGAGIYQSGQNATITAAPNAGYSFGTWTDANNTLVSFSSSYLFPVTQSQTYTAHFNVAASGNPDLVPTKFSPSGNTSFPGATVSIPFAVKNIGSGSTNRFATYWVLSNSNTVAPVPGDFLNTGDSVYQQINFSGLSSGIDGGGTVDFRLVKTNGSAISSGDYYLWFLVDPENAAGEQPANRNNNNVVVPLTVLPTPAIGGPDLAPHDFAVTTAPVLVGGTINVSGGIRNIGNAASNGFKYYISISTSPIVAPDKDALNSFGSVPALGIYLDAGCSAGVTLPGNIVAGNYYVWIMVDPENVAGEQAGNRANNNVVLPLTVVQPLQTFTVAAGTLQPTEGSVSGGGTYVAGAVVPLVATPDPGFFFVNWTDNNGNIVSVSPIYTFAATASESLTANFAATIWSVSPSSGAHGAISPAAPLIVADGGHATFTATPDPGYRVDTWKVNGALARVGGNSLILSNITANATVTVSFKSTSIPEPGDLDATFGVGGIVKTAVGSGGADGQAVVVQGDGKIIVAGSSYNGVNHDFALVRYNADGSLDTSFGSSGIVATDFSGFDDFACSIALQSDLKIVVAGYTYPSQFASAIFALVRYNADGTLDTSFGSGGKVTTGFFGYDSMARSVAVQGNGKIVVAGSASYNAGGGLADDLAVTRYNADGTPDASFGTGGKFTTHLGNQFGRLDGFGVAIQGDGKIVVSGSYTDTGSGSFAGEYTEKFALARLTANGLLDTTFGGSGVVITTFAGYGNYLSCLALQGDGKIVVAGPSDGSGSSDMALLRYNADGSLDTSFGNAGEVVTDFYGGSDAGQSVAIQGNGKIVVAGYAQETGGGKFDFGVARYNADGSLDTSFNEGGTANTSLGANSAQSYGMALQNDGKIVLAGWSSNGSNNLFALARYLGDPVTTPSYFVTNTNFPVVTSNLTAYWPFIQGSTADASGNGHNGSGINVTEVPDRNGYANNALQFDGSTSGIEIGSAFGMQNQQTVVAWVKPAAIAGTLNAIVEKADTGFGGEVDFELYVPSDGHVHWEVNTDDGGTGLFASIIGNTSLSIGQWTCLAAVIDRANNQTLLYVNGVLDGTSTMGGRNVRNQNRPFRIGKRIGNQGPGWFNGAIDDVAVYGKTLSPAEIGSFTSLQLSASGMLLNNGSSTVDFGTGVIGTGVTKTFGIGNIGFAFLLPGNVTIDGTNGPDFSLTTPPAGLVAGGAGTTFTLTFAPSTAGSETAGLHFRNFDPTGNSFNITLTGTGITPSDNWRKKYFGGTGNTGNAADMATPDSDGIANLLKYALVLTPGTSAAIALPPGQAQSYAEGTRLTINFTRDPTRSDVSIYVEAADSPAGPWTTVASSVNGASFNGSGLVSETDAGSGLKHVAVRDIVNITDATRRFMHVRVTR